MNFKIIKKFKIYCYWWWNNSFESIIHNIPSLVFGNNFYLDLSIFKINSLNEVFLIDNIKQYRSNT